jgi:hypothetical protein
MGSSPLTRQPFRRRSDRADPDAPVQSSESVRPQKAGFPFKAEVDMAELDERGRPGPMWAGRACELSRSQIIVNSRRMCYEGREALVAVHLVDDRPVTLFGKVLKSEYDGDGLYRTTLGLAPLPESDSVQAWISKLSTRT